jgi:heavy metal efflux system protein
LIADLVPLLLKRRLIAVFFALAMAGLGVWAMLRLKLEAYPDLSETQVTVITLFPGHAAEEVEQQVTVPVERALQSVPKVIARRSRTIFGLSVIDLTFQDSVDDTFARQAVLEKLRYATLPPGTDTSLAPPTTPAGELYRYTVEGADVDLVTLRELQDWVISPRFLQINGVGDAFAFGGLVKQYQIEVDPQALHKYGLALNRIADAVSANNQNAGGSLLNRGQQSMVVRGVGAIRSVDDIGNVVLASVKGVPVFVRDIGKVKIGPAIRNGIFGIGPRQDGVEGVVVMRRGENPSEVLDGIREAVEDLNATLPHGVHLVPVYDRTELVHSTVRTVSRTLSEGLALVFLVLVFFLGSFEAAILTALTIPLSLLFAFLAMHFAQIPASLLSLGAMDLGILVDGTLVMVELIVRRLRDASLDDTMGVVERAARQAQRPVFFSLLILIAAYVPLFTLERVERRLFTPMAYTLCAALIGSLLVALLLVPVLATWLFRHGARGWRNPFVRWIAGRYEALLRILLKRPAVVLMATLVVVAGCLSLGTDLGTEFLPQLDEGVMWIRMNLTPGISLEKSAQVAESVREMLGRFSEVALVTSQSGRQESNTEPFGPNRNEFLVALRPYPEWAGRKSKPALIQEISRRLRDEFPGASFNFTQPIIDMVTEAVTGSSADLAIILSGPNLETLRAKAHQSLELLRQVPGAADVAIEQESDQAQLRINVNRNEVARYGINVKDVQDVIELAIGGRPVSSVYEGDRVFDIVVRYIPEARSTVTNIGQIMIPAANGGSVPLSQLADIRIEDGASIIARRENRRQIAVRTNIRGRDQGSFVSEAQKLFASRVTLPPGYKVEWGGQFENLARARARLAWILPVTVALIFVLLYWAFGSALDAALVLVNVPFCIAGGVVALYLRGIHFSVSAAVGFVSLFGVAVMTGVLYLTEINQQMRAGSPPREAVLGGATLQFRPLIMLISIAMLGIMPAAFATGIGSDVQRPLATVIFGGLFSTLFLGLVGLPALCCLAKKRAPDAGIDAETA